VVNAGALATFIGSPVFSRVDPTTVPSTITATPVVSRLGIACQTLTQTIEIGGQSFRASAMLCRQADGSWQIESTRNAQTGEKPPQNAGGYSGN
jgi:surface antigen